MSLGSSVCYIVVFVKTLRVFRHFQKKLLRYFETTNGVLELRFMLILHSRLTRRFHPYQKQPQTKSLKTYLYTYYNIKSHYPILGLRRLKIGRRVIFMYGLDMSYTLELFFASFSSHFFVSSSKNFNSFAFEIFSIFLQHASVSSIDLGPQQASY